MTTNHLRKLKFFKVYFAVGIFGLCLVTYLTLTPDIQEIEQNLIKLPDKLSHTLAHFSLAFWFLQLYWKKREKTVVTCLFFYGILLEILQFFGGVRHFELSDILANSFGICVAFLLSHLIAMSLFDKFESIVGLHN